MKSIFYFLLFSLSFALISADNEDPATKKKSSLTDLAPPLQLDATCRVVSCYRNMLNVSNSCEKGEYLHSFKKCEKKFFREDTCCQKKKD